MSNSVDKRIVSMSFDNANFQKNMADTLSSLDKLKKAMGFGKEKGEIASLKAEGDKFNLNQMAEATNGISAKFAAMATIGITALSNLTNRAVDAGINIAKALTVAPVMDGFREYETNMNSIQTILANTRSKGEDLRTVSAALDELNTYADKTIYNFAEMTSAIGKFTASGLGLDESVAAIKGFSNAAATAGANAEATARAQQQLSQAMAAGSVRAMDWMSIENAGMATEMFRNSLLETARVHGVGVDAMIEKEGSFKASLSSGWLSSEIMAETLQKFTGDLTDAQLASMGYNAEQIAGIQDMARTAIDAATKVKTLTQLVETTKEAIGTGWSTSFKIVFGDFEEAQSLFTNISQGLGFVIDHLATARNELLQGWKDLGGRTTLLKGLHNIIVAVAYAMKPLVDAFRAFFPKRTAEDLVGLTNGFERFTRSIRDGVIKFGPMMYNVFFAIFAVMRLVTNVVKGVFSIFTSLGTVIGTLVGSLSGVATGGSSVLEWFGKAITAGDIVTRVFEFISGAILRLVPLVAGLGGIFSTAFGWISDKAGELYGVFLKFIPQVENGLVMGFLKVRDIALELYGVFEKFVPQIQSGLVEGFNKLRDVVGEVTDKISNLSVNFDFLSQAGEKTTGIMDFLKGHLETVGEFLVGVTSGLGDTMAKVGSVIVDGFSKTGEFLAGVGDGIVEIAKGVWEKIKSIIGGIFSPETGEMAMKGIWLGFAAGILKVLNTLFENGLPTFDVFNLGDLVDSASGAIDQLGNVLQGFSQKLKSEALMNIAKAVAVLAVSIALLAFIPGDRIAKSMGALAVGVGGMVGAIKLLTMMNPKTAGLSITTMATAMLLIAASTLALAAAIAILSFVDPKKAAISMGILAVGVLALGASVAMIGRNQSDVLKAGFSLLMLGLALIPLTAAVWLMSKLPWEDIKLGMLGIALGLGLFVAASNLIDEDGASKLGVSFLLFGLGLAALYKAVEKFSQMDLSTMGKGFAGLAGAMALLIITMRSLPKDMREKAVGLLIVAGAIGVMAYVIREVGEISLWDLIKSLGALALALGGMFLVTQGIAANPAAPAAMLAMAVAMGAVALSLKLLSSISLGSMLIALVGLAGAFIIMGVAGSLLAPVAPMLLALSWAVAAFGVAVLLTGAGVYMFAAGLERLGEASEASMSAIRRILLMIISLVPDMMAALGRGIIDMFTQVLNGVPALLETLRTVISTFIGVLVSLIPEALNLLRTLISGILTLIVDLAPQYVETVIFLITTMATAIRDNIATFVTLGVEILVNLIGGIIGSLGIIGNAVLDLLEAFVGFLVGNMDRIVTAGVDLLVAFLGGIEGAIDRILPAITNVILAILNGVASMIGLIIDAGAGIITSFITGMGNMAADIVTAVGTFITTLIDAIGDEATRIVTAAVDTAITFLGGLVDSTIKFIDHAWGFLNKFLDGIADAIDEHSVETARAMGKVAAELINGIVEGMGEFGTEVWERALRPALEGLLGRALRFWDIRSPSRVMADMGKNIMLGLGMGIDEDSKRPVRAAVASSEKINKVFDELMSSIDFGHMDEFNPTITPVLDLTKVQNEARGINALFAGSTIGSGSTLVAAERVLESEEDSRRVASEPSDKSDSTNISLTQINNSPEALTPERVYRQTRSQLAKAKKELEDV